ncbi:MAG: preprotein translocase subunit SecA [Gemmatimonadetes bacterium]|nr:preprotein translocase subunit SecA [Gemmatimonadota bacterium]
MLKNVVSQIVGTRFDREMKRIRPVIAQIKEHEQRLSAFTDEQLREQTDLFREVIAQRTAPAEARVTELREERAKAEDPATRADLTAGIADAESAWHKAIQEVLHEVLPEAFATVRETCRRLLGREFEVTGNKVVWDMVPYDVQLFGGIVLHQGKIAEMATGEGKTLVATMPLYLNALAGRGAHLVTVNEYLARRDSQWMGLVFDFLGLKVGCIDETRPGTEERREAYAADITYGTNNEFGFDYLRDNMVVDLKHRVQRGHSFAIIDEVDSVLVDEARTPLIISGPAGRDDRDIYQKHNQQVAALARKQAQVVNKLVADGARLLEEAEANDDPQARWDAGLKLLAARRGGPKHRRLLKVLAQTGAKQVLQKTEADVMREKRMPEVDELLLFAIEERIHSVHISDRGLEILSPNDPEAFTVPDISEEVQQVEDRPDLDADQKRAEIEALETAYAEKSERIHVIHQLVKAHALYEKDVEYVLEDGSVVIVDEFTGRKMRGRRWSDGLHQAVEAKEKVQVRGETQTLATITIQNYFRMYDKIGGMTGTAETEEGEFHEIYGLDVSVIPTNRPVRRTDHDDAVFQTKKEKYAALIDEIERINKEGLPILVGTTSVEVSELVSRMLKRRGLTHEVLNAKQHEREAQIVQDAGQPGAITIATNMAGRGTDIKIADQCIRCADCRTRSGRDVAAPGASSVSDSAAKDRGCGEDPSCGLQILGTERHESRRIDRQLRGRAGRQGDPGASLFFLSLEDDLMRLFMPERMAKVMDRLGVQEGEVIAHPWITKSIERAQKRVELQHFQARKRLLEYDDVMNQQREVVYDLRLYALEGGEDLRGETWEMIESSLRETMDERLPEGSPPETWDLEGLRQKLLIDYFLRADFLPGDEEGPGAEFGSPEDVHERVVDFARDQVRAKLDSFGDVREQVLRFVVLSVLDEKWKDHLYDLDHLRSSIQYRSWGQKDPLIEYKKEAYELFVHLMEDIRKTVAARLMRVQVSVRPTHPLPGPPAVTALSGASAAATGLGAAGGDSDLVTAGVAPGSGSGPVGYGDVPASLRADDSAQRAAMRAGGAGPRKRAPAASTREPGRNAPCPCGSGKKYKKCHGKL